MILGGTYNEKIHIRICFSYYVFSVYTFPVSALNDEISDIEVNYELLDLDLSSDAETYEKTIYLYPKEVLEDGTILVGVTDDTDDLVSMYNSNDTNWNVAILLYAERISDRYYKITATAITQAVLIHSFYINLSYGDGHSSGTLSGYNQPPFIDDCSFTSIATAYYKYDSTGSYTISMKSGSISVCDVVHPEVSESARPDCSDYVLKVT